MTHKLLCPFCNKPLQPTLRQSDEYWCENYDCPGTSIEWVGSQKLWQELIKLMEEKQHKNTVTDQQDEVWKIKVAKMSKDIWHTVVEAPKPWVSIAFYVDGYLYNGYYESEFNKYGIFGADKVEKWCYVKELSSYILTLETENKDLSDKIGKLEIELDRIRKALDVALKGLDDIIDSGDGGYWTAIKTKEQITALEQKDK